MRLFQGQARFDGGTDHRGAVRRRPAYYYLASKLETLLSFKRAISRRFNIKDQGELATMLGMEIRCNWKEGTFEISQRRYILEISKRK